VIVTSVTVDYLDTLLHLNASILIVIHLSVDVLKSLQTEAVSLRHTCRAHLQTWICGERRTEELSNPINTCNVDMLSRGIIIFCNNILFISLLFLQKSNTIK